MQNATTESWHDGLPTELPPIVALPDRPRMRVRKQTTGEIVQHARVAEDAAHAHGRGLAAR